LWESKTTARNTVGLDGYLTLSTTAPIFIVALAGIALLGTISHNIALAFGPVEDREAALFTFLCSASGIQFFGVGSAFWGLIVGIVVFIVLKFKAKK
ncbi:benzoate/H(+) symporter BenE family transporter, partial [Acinetobacter baumannii]|uniref:benzoate/H(+) symporter BenE family transporter n=1 Tax=Acinetobacter baumannii TaxID=470 RepID=UPI001D172503